MREGDALAVAPAADSRRSLGLALALALALLMLAAFAVALRRTNAAPRAGEPAPDFRLTTFAGEEIALSELRGQVVVLNFWASWCQPCAVEAADLEQIWRDYRERGVTLVGIGYTDTEPAARAYLEQHDITYPNAPDRQATVSRRYHISGVPETFVVDQAGRLVGIPTANGEVGDKVEGPVAPGGPLTVDQLRALLDRLLAEGIVTAETLLVALVVGAVAVAVAVYVMRPLLGGAEALDEADPRAVALLAMREGVLATLRDLDADRADGRLSEADYQALRAESVAQGAQVLATLDRVAADSAGRTAAIARHIEDEVAAAGGGSGRISTAPESPVSAGAGQFCTHCGHPRRPDDRFCGGCGQALDGAREPEA